MGNRAISRRGATTVADVVAVVAARAGDGRVAAVTAAGTAIPGKGASAVDGGGGGRSANRGAVVRYAVRLG